MFYITIEYKSCDTFLLRYCEKITKFLNLELWTCLVTSVKVTPACRNFDAYLDPKNKLLP